MSKLASGLSFLVMALALAGIGRWGLRTAPTSAHLTPVQRAKLGAEIDRMMTTGSVRGKCSARHDEQSRRQPAWLSAVGAPQFGQNR